MEAKREAKRVPDAAVHAAAEAMHPLRVNDPALKIDGCGCQEADEHEFFMRGDEEAARLALEGAERVWPHGLVITEAVITAAMIALSKNVIGCLDATRETAVAVLEAAAAYICAHPGAVCRPRDCVCPCAACVELFNDFCEGGEE